MSLNDALHWRYAPKRMTGQKLTDDELNAIIKAAQYAPTSMGLQPFQLILVDDPSMKEKIKPIAYHQPQILESSHLLIFCSYLTLHEIHIDRYLNNIQDTRSVTAESLQDFRKSMLRFAQSQSAADIAHWAANQAYIAIGFALAEAALIGVDVTPMEGFSVAQLNDLLGLEARNLSAVAILALGKRDVENDFLANEPKVRRPLEELVERI